MAKQKYYVVWNGVAPGIYSNWTDCQVQIKGYPGALYKSYKSEKEAQEAYSDGPTLNPKKSTTAISKTYPEEYPKEVVLSAIAVDAACSGNPGKMEYRGVYVKDKAEIFKVGPMLNGTNNIGEFLAIVHALALLDKQGSRPMTIYSDSRTAMIWIRKKKANTKLKRSKSADLIYKMIAKAERWLATHTYPHTLLKWETKKWGEIPADFGRK